MAKLTARFGIQDRITKKLKAIRGEVESLERARNKVNRPMVMRVRDQATKVLKKLHMFVLNDIAKKHEISVQAKDQATKVLTALSGFMKKRMPRTHALFVSANDKASPILQKINRFTQRNIARAQIMTILATDRAMPTIRRIGNFARSTLSKGFQFTVRAVDTASRVVGRIASYTATAIPRVRTFTISAINMASNVIGSVKRALFSIPTVITVTLAAVGVSKLNEATVGAAMNFEDYGVAMNHWLRGDKKAADELMTWMGQKADKTPYSSPDIFPAMVGAVSLAGNDQAWIKRLTSASIDMAALSGGTRTVDDAMQALVGAKMGNYEMLKGFGLNITKKDFDKMGWDGFISHVEGEFQGGAEALSKTARGILATLKGYRGSLLRTLGSGILDPMKPRLDAINQWLDKNQDTWGRWKSVVERNGKEASEWVFSKLENGFKFIRSRYLDNKKFMDLDFEGKIKFVAEDISAWWSSKGKPALQGWWETSGKPWAEKIGLFLGKTIFDGIVLGIKEGGKALGNMWMNFMKDPSLSNFGGAGVATMLAAALSSLVLSPLIKGISMMVKLTKGAWGLGKKAVDLSSKGGKAPKGGKASGTPLSTRRKPKTPKSTPVYTQPWFNKGQKVTQNVPNTKGEGFKFPKGLSKFGASVKRVPIIGTALGALSIASAEKDERAGVIGGVAGGLAGAKGGALAGAALGSVVPGVGTAIGGAAGGIIGGIGGALGGEWIGNHWEAVKEKAADAFSWIGEKASDAKGWIGEKFTEAKEVVSNTFFNSGWWSEKWSNVKEWGSKKLSDTKDWWNGVKKTASETLFSSNWWIEQGGVVYGYLESTIFSGSWWLSKWETVKQWSEGTIFDGAWWSEKWSAVMEWTSEKWDSAIEIWESVKTAFAETVFSSEWWAGNWDAVKVWTQERWDSAVTIWNSVKTAFAETVFNSEWWVSKWESVMSWTQSKWDSAVTIWNSIKEKINETIFNSEWWNSKWDAVKSWTSDKWDKAVSIWENVKTSIGNTLFSSEWWNSKWDSVLSWGKTKLGELGTWVSKKWDGVKESFSKGREKGQSYANYAQGISFHPGGPAIVGDGGGPELIRYPSGAMSLSPGTDTLMNLPRGTEVLSHAKTKKFFSKIPAYADGIGFGGNAPEKAILPQEQVEVATSSTSRSNNATGGKIRDIIVQITGANHYSDDMDAEKVGVIAWNTIKKKLEEEYFEGGEMLVDG